ncbi:hypothetical protein G9A89_018571 [Geosiphon pyriformis]|nr:hypothetical protein G9A89_018571 [Geosiphon pyriformis]
MVKKTKSSEKWKQSLVSAIVIPNSFVVSNKILDEISIASSGISFKIGLNQPLAVLPNVVSFGRLLPVLEAKQSPPIGLSVLGNWADQIETESSPPLVAFTLVLGATFKIKLAHVKTVFQLVHGFLGAKSVSKNNVKLFCVEFASQVSLKAVFLVEFTSFVHLATLKIAKSLVISESGSPSAAIALCDMLLDVFTTDIKMALSVFGSVTYVVLKPAGIWQYVVVYFEKLDSAVFALNYWLVLTILSCDKFKAKLVNLPSGCTAFEISNMISQVGGQTCFISRFFESGCHFQFALVTFELGYLATDYKVSPPSPPKFFKVFTLCFVGSKSYAKAFAPLDSSEFPPLLSFVSFPVVLSALIESIIKPIGFLVTIFEQFINGDLVSSSALGLRINEVLVHISSFSRTVGKLGREVVFLKKEYCMEDFDMSGNLELLSIVEHKSVDIKTNLFKTAKWLVGLVSCSTTLFSVIQKMSSLDKFSSIILV